MSKHTEHIAFFIRQKLQLPALYVRAAALLLLALLLLRHRTAAAAGVVSGIHRNAAFLAGSSRLVYPADVKIIRVPCSCRVNPMFILRAFEKGADGVILCGCHPGDCHYSTGNYYARRRMALLFSMLDYIGVEHGRTRVEWVSAAEGVKFSQTMNEFVAKITSLGKNVRLEDLRCRK